MNKEEAGKIIFKNIDAARSLSTENESMKMVALVSGADTDQENWQHRFNETKSFLFNSDNSSSVLSLVERIGNKRREGNFLGTLLAYRRIKEYAWDYDLDYRDCVILVGMIFGRGERMSPFTQIEGNRKPAIKVNSCGFEDSRGNKQSLMAIEEALMYFTPVGKYMENRGFRGILDKWGDETEIGSIDLTDEPELPGEFAESDVIKVVSVIKITEELAKQKDWVVFNDDRDMVGQLSRDEKTNLIEKLKERGIQPAADGDFYGGVSLGPVAVSYNVLDIASDVFAEEIEKEGVWIDFDPYFLMALTMQDDRGAWDAAVAADKSLRELTAMVPDFFEKVQSIKTIFKEKYKRELNIKVLDLGADVYWADIGQHKSMREKYLSLLDDSFEGEIARHLENINIDRDGKNNIIVNSEIDPSVSVENSVIINSRLTGTGSIKGCVVKESLLNNPVMDSAFAINSNRPSGSLSLKKNSGIYHSLGKEDLLLDEEGRSGTLLTADGPVDLKVFEETNLRDRENTYNKPVYGNKISFAEAYDLMMDVGMEEIDRRRRELLDSF